MDSLGTAAPRLKPRKADPARCPTCLGTGYDLTDGRVSPCGDCAGCGRGRSRATFYLATVAADLVDVGTCAVEDFVGRLTSDWPGLRGDIIVWLVRDEICPEPRAVALVRPGRDGKPAVTWLGG